MSNYINQQPFPYASLALIQRDDIERVRSRIEDYIEQTYSKIENVDDSARNEISRIIRLEVKKHNIKDDDRLIEGLENYYL